MVKSSWTGRYEFSCIPNTRERNICIPSNPDQTPQNIEHFCGCNQPLHPLLSEESHKFSFLPTARLVPGPEVIKLFSCLTQLSMTFSLLINMKMPTDIGIFIFTSTENFAMSYTEQENNSTSQFFAVYKQVKFYAQLSLAWKKVL